MHTLRKYTGFGAKIHSFALFFLILFPFATPQLSTAFAQDNDQLTKVLKTPQEPEAVAGEFLISFKDKSGFNSLSQGKKPQWLQSLDKDATVDTSLSLFNIAHVKLSNPTASGNWENLANTLAQDPTIESVEPNYIHYILNDRPNDTHLDQLWYLQQTSAFKAWEKARPTTKDDIIVAVLDTGIQYDHEDLAGNIWRNDKEIPNNRKDDDDNGYVDDVVGWNFYDNNKFAYSYLNPYPVAGTDPNTGRFLCTAHPTRKLYEMHGTHVAGTIAAIKNNATGIAGIAERVKIMPLKVMGGPCGQGTSAGIMLGLQYAADHGAKIVNLSLGSIANSPLEKRMYKALSDRGILIVASAGNNAFDNDDFLANYPASYPAEGIISVAATKQDDNLARFSNFGKVNVDLAAPGVEILSTIPDGTNETPTNSYAAFSGTSMSAPIVAGAAALLLAQDPSLTNLQLKAKLLQSVDKVPALADKVATGGRLNIDKALSRHHVVAKQPEPPSQPSPTTRSAPADFGGIRVFDHREKTQKW